MTWPLSLVTLHLQGQRLSVHERAASRASARAWERMERELISSGRGGGEDRQPSARPAAWVVVDHFSFAFFYPTQNKSPKESRPLHLDGGEGLLTWMDDLWLKYDQAAQRGVLRLLERGLGCIGAQAVPAPRKYSPIRLTQILHHKMRFDFYKYI